MSEEMSYMQVKQDMMRQADIKFGKWVDMKDMPPKDLEVVLVKTEHTIYPFSAIYRGGIFYDFGFWGASERPTVDVICWTRMPEE